MPIYYYGSGGGGALPANPKFSVVEIAVNGDLEVGNLYKADCASGAITLTLPEAIAFVGESVIVKKTDSTVNDITIEPSSGNDVNGDVNYIMSGIGSCVSLISDGNDWIVISRL